jgi:hypothetical protein
MQRANFVTLVGGWLVPSLSFHVPSQQTTMRLKRESVMPALERWHPPDEAELPSCICARRRPFPCLADQPGIRTYAVLWHYGGGVAAPIRRQRIVAGCPLWGFESTKHDQWRHECPLVPACGKQPVCCGPRSASPCLSLSIAFALGLFRFVQIDGLGGFGKI